MNRKVLLMILDGWGEGRHDYSNAIWTNGTPNIDALRAKYPYGHLQACGEYPMISPIFPAAFSPPARQAFAGASPFTIASASAEQPE